MRISDERVNKEDRTWKVSLQTVYALTCLIINTILIWTSQHASLGMYSVDRPLHQHMHIPLTGNMQVLMYLHGPGRFTYLFTVCLLYVGAYHCRWNPSPVICWDHMEQASESCVIIAHLHVCLGSSLWLSSIYFARFLSVQKQKNQQRINHT